MMDLIKRIEAATKGSRELDAEVYNTTPENGRVAMRLPMEKWRGRFDDGWYVVRSDKGAEDKYPERLPHYTTSIDAALTLVPEGAWDWSVHEYLTSSYQNRALAKVGPAVEDRHVHGSGRKPALALCIAALKARAETD